MTSTDRKRLSQLLLGLSALLLAINLVFMDYSNFEIHQLLSPLSNILLIVAMYVVIKDINKKAKN